MVASSFSLDSEKALCVMIDPYLRSDTDALWRGMVAKMQTTAVQKKALDQYYKELAAYHEKKVTHESAVRSAFQYLLSAFAQSANWVLIPEQRLANGKRPDGTLRDSFNLPRGYWEAKDTKDDLSTEIRK